MKGFATREFRLSSYLMTLRPHQWLKNILIVLPAVAAHDFRIDTLLAVLIACVSISFGASSVYIVNDMLDLTHDRMHVEKRHRPLAAGLVSLRHTILLFWVAVTLSVFFASKLPPKFMLVVIIYFGLSMGYSLYLKRKLMIDVVVLAMLYGIRVVAGGIATGIALSHWLVGFCFFIFLSLALVKRTGEIAALAPTHVDNVGGRDYRREDLPTIIALAAASGFVAVLVLALYVNSPEVRPLYRHPEMLWGISAILVWWLGYVYLVSGRGEMHYDPIIFAATDRTSLLAGLLSVLIFVLAF